MLTGMLLLQSSKQPYQEGEELHLDIQDIGGDDAEVNGFPEGCS